MLKAKMLDINQGDGSKASTIFCSLEKASRAPAGVSPLISAALWSPCLSLCLVSWDFLRGQCYHS